MEKTQLIKNLQVQVQKQFPSKGYHDVEEYLKEEDAQLKKSLDAEYINLNQQICELKQRLQNKQKDLQNHLAEMDPQQDDSYTDEHVYTPQKKKNLNQPFLQQDRPMIPNVLTNNYNLQQKWQIIDQQQTEESKNPETIKVKQKRFIILYENSGSQKLQGLRNHFETSLAKLISELNPTETTIGLLEGEKIVWQRNIQKQDLQLPDQVSKQGLIFKTSRKPKLEILFNEVLKEVKRSQKETDIEILLLMRGIKKDEVEKLKLPELNTLVHILGVGSEFVSSFSLLSRKFNKSDRNDQTGCDYFEVVGNLREITSACKNLKQNMYFSQQNPQEPQKGYKNKINPKISIESNSLPAHLKALTQQALEEAQKASDKVVQEYQENLIEDYQQTKTALKRKKQSQWLTLEQSIQAETIEITNLHQLVSEKEKQLREIQQKQYEMPRPKVMLDPHSINQIKDCLMLLDLGVKELLNEMNSNCENIINFLELYKVNPHDIRSLRSYLVHILPK